MLADSQTLTHAVLGALVFPRIASSNGQAPSLFRLADGTMLMTVNHALSQKGSRRRSTVRLDLTKIAADPLQPATNVPYVQSFYLVADRPVVGFTTTEAFNLANTLIGWTTASAGANLTKVLGLES